MTRTKTLALATIGLLAVVMGCRSAASVATGGEASAAARGPTLRDLDGQLHAPLWAPAGGASVLIFSTSDCPIANGYAPQINQLVARYRGRPVGFYLVHVDPAITAARARQHARDFGYTMPVLIDAGHDLVRAAGATVTPEAAIYAGGRLRYRGRINNWYGEVGRKRALVSRHELRDALDALLAQRPVAVERTAAIGCLIPAR
jgi:hypothetical protein